MAARRVARILVGALGGLLLLAVAWIVVTGVLARSRLNDVRAQISAYEKALASGDTTRARAVGLRIERDTGSAHQLTSGPAWWVGSHILGVGTPLQTARTISLAADRLATGTIPQVSGVIAEIEGQHHTADSIDLAGLRGAAARLTNVRTLVATTTTAVRSSQASWFGPVSGGRRAMLTKLASLTDDVEHADQAVQTVVPMLGARTPQRYFVAFLNEAESRSIGGLPGAFAIVTADHGHIAFEHFGSDTDLVGVRAQVDLGAEYERLYGQDDPAGVIQNSDIGPSFPDAARIWAGMWLAKTGEHIDGAVSIDPSAVGILLRASGATRTPSGIAVNAHNIVDLTESRQYVLYPGFQAAEARERKHFLDSVARAVADKLLHSGSLTQLLTPLRQAAGERRILVWSDVAAREKAIVAAGLGGVFRPGRAPFSAFTVNNSTGSKLDFYLHRTMTYRSNGCAAGRSATATFTLDNDTPSYPLPPYVTYIAGGRPAGTAPGWNRLIVTYYATPGATIRSVTLDGVPQHLTAVTENAFTTVRLLVPVTAGGHSTLTVVTSEPAATGPLQIVKQPLVHPMKVTVSQPSCALRTARPTTAYTTIALSIGSCVFVLVALAGIAWRSRRAEAGSAVGEKAGNDR